MNSTQQMGNITLDEAYERIEGLPWVLDGVRGHLHVVQHTITEVEHHADRYGKRSKAYLETKERLGDHYVTTINNHVTLGEIFAHVAQMEG